MNFGILFNTEYKLHNFELLNETLQLYLKENLKTNYYSTIHLSNKNDNNYYTHSFLGGNNAKGTKQTVKNDIYPYTKNKHSQAILCFKRQQKEYTILTHRTSNEGDFKEGIYALKDKKHLPIQLLEKNIPNQINKEMASNDILMQNLETLFCYNADDHSVYIKSSLLNPYFFLKTNKDYVFFCDNPSFLNFLYTIELENKSTVQTKKLLNIDLLRILPSKKEGCLLKKTANTTNAGRKPNYKILNKIILYDHDIKKRNEICSMCNQHKIKHGEQGAFIRDTLICKWCIKDEQNLNLRGYTTC